MPPSRCRRWCAAAAIALVPICSACSGGPAASGGAASPSVTPTYVLPQETARFGETVIRPSPAVDGMTRFWLIGFRDGMPSLLGSHAEWPAKGRFARARIVLQNTDRTYAKFEAKRQVLVASDGREFHVDNSAQEIKRQPDEIMVGSFVRMEFDLWFDVPKDARITKLRLYGEPPFGSVTPTKGVEFPIG
ncbi:MAG: DUF4352 domain-containing protein [Microbispora sp.]|nr:DUF4352 domain-containing protein [Microbispora sp.]